jgi:hypothetical protein
MNHTEINITETTTANLAANAVFVTNTQILCMMSVYSGRSSQLVIRVSQAYDSHIGIQTS